MKSELNLTEISHFYHQFSELQSAGLNSISILDSFKSTENNLTRQQQFKWMIDDLQKGRTLSETFSRHRFLPFFDNPYIKAGEKSGRLVDIFQILSKKYQQSSEAEKKIKAQMFKPVFTLALALFVPRFPDLFIGKITLFRYLLGSLGVLSLLFLISYYLYRLFMESYYDLDKARTKNQILSSLPFFSGLNQKISLESFSMSLAMMLESGIDIYEALDHAAQTTARPDLLQAQQRVSRQLKAGQSLKQAFSTETLFTHELIKSITLGAESGKLPEFLRRFSQSLKSEIEKSIESLVRALPMIVYWFITGYVVWVIFGFYSGHLNDLNQILID